MTESVLERAAKAIHDELENDDDSGGGGYMRAARAVLQAIREPSEGMIEELRSSILREYGGLSPSDKYASCGPEPTRYRGAEAAQ